MAVIQAGSRTRAVPPVATGEAAIALDRVTKQYRGGGGVREISLEVRPGEVFGFLGPNGAGKTTTIRLLVDLIRPDAGSIHLFGLDVRRDSVAIRHRIGYLPGDLALYEHLTARELLTHFSHLRHGPAWHDVQVLADRFDLELDRPVRALSRGNRQKVGLVQAMMGRPELLILDEPTSGLDPIVQQEVHAVITEAADEGRSVFLSSHVLSEVGRVADRVGLIRDGRLIAVRTVDDLRERTLHLVDVRLDDPGGDGALDSVDGVTHVERRGASLHLEVSGSLDPLIRELSTHRVAELTIREPDLEETFLSFYGGDHDHP